MKLLVVGARPDSLGAHVRRVAEDAGMDVVTAGMSGEDISLDATQVADVIGCMEAGMWDHVVCTVGVNHEGTIQGKGWASNLHKHMQINFMAPMILLSEWARTWRDTWDAGTDNVLQGAHHFVAISSNSAHVARSKSGAYCASKAALSMGIRCAAREQASYPFAIYAYEPGWLNATPMSMTVATRMKRGHDGRPVQAHRIPGFKTVPPEELAEVIVHNIMTGSAWLNGCTLRVDGGEQ